MSWLHFMTQYKEKIRDSVSKRLRETPPLPRNSCIPVLPETHDRNRWRFILSGRVQNIGLRYRAYMLAQDLPVTGGVGNLDDGTVELEVQGENVVIHTFLEQINQLPGVRLDDITAEEIPVISEKSFRMWN